VGWPIDRPSSVIKEKSVQKLMDRIVYFGRGLSKSLVKLRSLKMTHVSRNMWLFNMNRYLL